MKRFVMCLALVATMLVLVTGCATGNFTSIKPEGGNYVLTGWAPKPMVGPTGFVWICTYDHSTKTMTVVEKLP